MESKICLLLFKWYIITINRLSCRLLLSEWYLITARSSPKFAYCYQNGTITIDRIQKTVILIRMVHYNDRSSQKLTILMRMVPYNVITIDRVKNSLIVIKSTL